jgi:hypothetical protein
MPLLIVSLLTLPFLFVEVASANSVGTFEKTIVPFLEDYCLDCHDSATQKGNLSLEELTPEFLDTDKLEIWRMVRDQLHFRDMPPQKKDQPTPEERQMVLNWLRKELLNTQTPQAATPERLSLPQFGNYVDHQFLFEERLPAVFPAPPRLWRLRPDIYQSVMPRLGENIRGLANGLSYLDGPVIKDYSQGYFIDEAATAPLLGNAKKVAAALVGERSRDQLFKKLVIPNQPPTPDEVSEALRFAFVKIIGRRATQEEEERFVAFYQKAKTTGDHLIAAKAMITAILMQPEFLFRSELGAGEPDEFGRIRLSPSETAFALSYALGNTPNDHFIKPAQENKLSSKVEIARLVESALLDDTVSQEKNPRIFQFFREYFDYPNATEIFKDAPPEGQHEASWLVADLEMTMADILRKDRNVLAELLTTRKFYVNAKRITKNGPDQGKLEKRHVKRGKYHTAFSLPPDWRWAAHLQPVTFPSDERAGILTHPAWLAAWSGNFDNHPVQRGKWIRTHLLGGSVPDVPIGVDARVPEKEHTSFRNRLKAATHKRECWRCHQNMDPLGLAFERYDHYGRYQRIDATQTVDASAEVSRTMSPDLHQKFSGPTEMIDFLAKSEHVEQVFVRYAFRFFMGRNETLGDANTLQDAHQAYRKRGGSFRALVASLLTSDSFLLRQAQPIPEKKNPF